jgi:transcription antitermination protein NusB
MASRRKARILAFQALYAWEASRLPLDELLDFEWLDETKRKNRDDESLAFSRLIVTGTIENMAEIDGAIKRQLRNWDITRLSKVDLAILRISSYALLFQGDMPASITIDEAIDISKEYSSIESFKFINGVLDGLRKARSEVP